MVEQASDVVLDAPALGVHTNVAVASVPVKDVPLMKEPSTTDTPDWLPTVEMLIVGFQYAVNPELRKRVLPPQATVPRINAVHVPVIVVHIGTTVGMKEAPVGNAGTVKCSVTNAAQSYPATAGRQNSRLWVSQSNASEPTLTPVNELSNIGSVEKSRPKQCSCRLQSWTNFPRTMTRIASNDYQSLGRTLRS